MSYLHAAQDSQVERAKRDEIRPIEPSKDARKPEPQPRCRIDGCREPATDYQQVCKRHAVELGRALR